MRQGIREQVRDRVRKDKKKLTNKQKGSVLGSGIREEGSGIEVWDEGPKRPREQSQCDASRQEALGGAEGPTAC